MRTPRLSLAALAVSLWIDLAGGSFADITQTAEQAIEEADQTSNAILQELSETARQLQAENPELTQAEAYRLAEQAMALEIREARPVVDPLETGTGRIPTQLDEKAMTQPVPKVLSIREQTEKSVERGIWEMQHGGPHPPRDFPEPPEPSEPAELPEPSELPRPLSRTERLEHSEYERVDRSDLTPEREPQERPFREEIERSVEQAGREMTEREETRPTRGN